MTDIQRREFDRYLAWYQGECAREPLRLALVLAGRKPATLISPYPWMSLHSTLTFSSGTVKLFDLFELAYREIKEVPVWFVARTSSRLDLLPTVRNGDCDAYHRRLGVICGYPADAIEYFLEHDEPRTQPHDLVEAGTFEATELAYTNFVFYLHDDSEEGYERAIASGKETYAYLGELADDWNFPTLKIITDTVYNHYVDEYSGE